ncbi:polysaccharide deacetylase family protein [uncultured Clostridium sp.]|uniref:polysaccharide deacetylase family protein n=1 Tax=uncultured Clostridium sp. TaxID=59620 RepID=UPI00258E9AD4|nr:polysaccharide deacetylase family protein [uncultured Clostridium sp.]
MKKIFTIILWIAIIILIILGGKYLYNKEYEKNKVEDANSNEVIENEDKDIEVQEEKLPKKNENDYVTLNINDVRIPILMYHSISDADPNNSLLIPVKQFEEQIKWLKESGFTPMLLDDIVEAYTTGYVPKKPVAITFDDGYSDNYTDAYRILKENNMKGTFFIITNNIDADGFYMNSAMLKEMKEGGMGIENHTSRHIEFTNISRDDKANIIVEGINELKEKVGVDSKYICYPVGRYDEETIEVEKEIGIKAAVTTEYGISSINDGLYSLKRVRIFPMDIESFKNIFKDFLN